MTAYEITYLLTIVILLYRMVYNLLVFFRNRSLYFILYFGLAQFFFALYLIFALQTINVESHADAFLYERLENAVIPLMAASFLFFFQSFRPAFAHTTVRIALGLFVLGSLIILFHPHAYGPGLEAPKTYEYLNITIYETEQPLIVLLILLAIFATLLRILIQYAYQDHGQNRRPLFLIIALVLFSACAMVDILVSLQVLLFPYTLHLGVIVLLFAVEDIFHRDPRLLRRKLRRASARPADFNPQPGVSPRTVPDEKQIPDSSTSPADSLTDSLEQAVRDPGNQQSSLPGDLPGQVDRINQSGSDLCGSAEIRIHVLGRLDIFQDGKLVPFNAYSRQKKLLILLKHLILSYSRWVRRETIMEALWPGTPEAKALNNLHALCFRLRKVFNNPDALVFLDEGLYLNSSIVELDWHNFEQMLKQFNNLLRSGELDGAAHIYDELNLIYRGEFFEFDPFFEEAAQKRTEIRESFKKALILYTRKIPGAHQADRREEIMRRALELDNLDETLWQILIQSLLEQGKQAQALKRFKQLESLLRKELDTEPDDATRSLLG